MTPTNTSICTAFLAISALCLPLAGDGSDVRQPAAKPDQLLALLNEPEMFDTDLGSLVMASVAKDGTLLFSDLENHRLVLWEHGEASTIGCKGLDKACLCLPYANAFGSAGKIHVVDLCKPNMLFKTYARDGTLVSSQPFSYPMVFKPLEDGNLLLGAPVPREGSLFLVHVLNTSGEIVNSAVPVPEDFETLVRQYCNHVSLDIYNGKIYVMASVLRQAWVLSTDLKVLSAIDLVARPDDIISLYFDEAPQSGEELVRSGYEKMSSAIRPWTIRAWKGGVVVEWIRPSGDRDDTTYLLDILDHEGRRIVTGIETNMVPIGCDSAGDFYWIDMGEGKENEHRRIVKANPKSQRN